MRTRQKNLKIYSGLSIAKVGKVELVSGPGSNFLKAILTFSQTPARGSLKSNDQPRHTLLPGSLSAFVDPKCGVRPSHTMKPRLSSPGQTRSPASCVEINVRFDIPAAKTNNRSDPNTTSVALSQTRHCLQGELITEKRSLMRIDRKARLRTAAMRLILALQPAKRRS